MEKGDGHRFSLLDKKPVHAILLIFKQVKHQYNLQYFSYHYHHYNEHYISKFWQVRNLRLPFHYLPKLPFWQACWLVVFVCLFVCYLPQFTFWQVCSLVVFVITCQNLHFGKYVGWSCLLLAKITILASMFVGRVCLSVCLFVTCQNYHFGKYVGWSCLSVCLSVCLYGTFTKSQERLSQPSPNLVTRKH